MDNLLTIYQVHNELKNTYRKLVLYLEQRYGCTMRRQTFNRRRTTAATFVGQDGLSSAKNALNSYSASNKTYQMPHSSNVSFNNNRVDVYIYEINDSHI